MALTKAQLIDLNANELILDLDADTSLTADTDDQIDIKIGGADDFTFTANAFNVLTGSHATFADSANAKFGTGSDMLVYHDGSNSYITNAVGALKVATETSGIAITIGHSTSEVTVADNMTVAGDLAVTGTASFGDTNITNVGSIALDTITNDGTDITLDSSADIIIDAAGGNIEFKDAGTLQFTIDMDTTSGVQIIKLGVDTDDLVFQQYDGNEVVRIADDRRLYFYDKGGEYIYGDGTDLHITSGADINIPSSIGLTFGNDGEKIEGDGTDLTISGNNINLTAVADVVIPANVGITFGTGEKIEGDSTDLTVTSGGALNLTATTDVVIPANVGITFGSGEKIEGDSTDLTVTSGGALNLTATTDVVIPANVGVTFGSGEKIEGDSTDLTVTSGAKINLTATSDVHIPNDVGIVFGGASEKIEGDGTDLTISANNLTIDCAADLILDAAGNNITLKSGGTSLLDFVNTSSDVVIKPMVDAKDIIFQQYDGTSIMEINDAAYARFTAAAIAPEATLTDASTISWNSLTESVAKVTLGANRTMGLASGGVSGAFISLLVIQDGTGSRTISWNAAYEFAADTAPTLTTTAAKGDLFVFRYNGAKWLEVGRNLALTLS